MKFRKESSALRVFNHKKRGASRLVESKKIHREACYLRVAVLLLFLGVRRNEEGQECWILKFFHEFFS